jgi:hypothetical protein
VKSHRILDGAEPAEFRCYFGKTILRNPTSKPARSRPELRPEAPSLGLTLLLKSETRSWQKVAKDFFGIRRRRAKPDRDFVPAWGARSQGFGPGRVAKLLGAERQGCVSSVRVHSSSSELLRSSPSPPGFTDDGRYSRAIRVSSETLHDDGTGDSGKVAFGPLRRAKRRGPSASSEDE